MLKSEKQKFRMSTLWKNFPAKMKRKAQGFDWLTKQPLTKTWNLHHLDMRDKNYTNISNPERFMPLNESTHDFIHWLYRIWLKDNNVLVRLNVLMHRMYEYNHDTPKSLINSSDAENI